MKLKAIEVENYRSILKTTRIPIDPGLTVIVGPNNEGKSNLLRSMEVAMSCLRYTQLGATASTEGPNRFRTPRSYSWELDFPLSKQRVKKADQKSRFVLEFELSQKDSSDLIREVDVNISGNLPVEIILGENSFHLNIRKKRAASLTRIKSIKLAKFIESRFLFQYIEAIRPSSQSLQVVGALVEQELRVLQSNEEYLKAIQVIEDLETPVLERLSLQVGENLKQLLPSVKSTVIERVRRTLPSRATTNRMPIQLIVDDGNATELEAKGDGVKSLVAISLLRALRGDNGGCDVVLAIEEPESHLHPKAIRELNRVFSEMSLEHQLIITTHSPQLVVRGKLQANVIVRSSSAKQATRISEIRECLGVVAQDNLMSAEYIVLVEGKSDEALLNALLCSMSSEFSDMAKQGRIVFENMAGSSNVRYKLSHFDTLFAKAIVVFDDDVAGRKSLAAAKQYGLPSKYCFCLQRPGNLESEIEDIFDCSKYWGSFCEEMGADLSYDAFTRSKLKWSERMKHVFLKASKSWDEHDKSTAKRWLHSWAMNNLDSSLTEESRESLNALVSAISRILRSDS